MARLDVYVTAGNDQRDVSIGGCRGNASSGWCRINSDNASKSDCSIFVKAEVVGQRQLNGAPRKTCPCGYRWLDEDDSLIECPKCGKRRQGIDTRKTCFTVELPEQTDENCEVVIGEHGHRFKELLAVGAVLCALKGVTEIAEGKKTDNEYLIGHGKSALKFAKEHWPTLDQSFAKGKEYSNVILPGGVSLAKALLAVELLDRITKGDQSSN